MYPITAEDVLSLLIQKEKAITALTQQTQALAGEIDRLTAIIASLRPAEPTQES